MDLIRHLFGVTTTIIVGTIFFSWFLPLLNPEVQVYIDAGYLGFGAVLSWAMIICFLLLNQHFSYKEIEAKRNKN